MSRPDLLQSSQDVFISFNVEQLAGWLRENNIDSEVCEKFKGE